MNVMLEVRGRRPPADDSSLFVSRKEISELRVELDEERLKRLTLQVASMAAEPHAEPSAFSLKHLSSVCAFMVRSALPCLRSLLLAGLQMYRGPGPLADFSLMPTKTS